MLSTGNFQVISKSIFLLFRRSAKIFSVLEPLRILSTVHIRHIPCQHIPFHNVYEPLLRSKRTVIIVVVAFQACDLALAATFLNLQATTSHLRSFIIHHQHPPSSNHPYSTTNISTLAQALHQPHTYLRQVLEGLRRTTSLSHLGNW